MLGKALANLFLAVCSREALILLGLFLILVCGLMIKEQCLFVLEYASLPPGHDRIEEVEGIVDGLGGILVAAGVFLEERDTLRKLALGDAPVDNVQARLNEVAHQNGMGLLLMGLFLEIGTLLIGLPARVLDAKRFERVVFGGCALLSVAAVLILCDLLRDYVLTYRLRPVKPVDPPASP